MKNPNYNYLFFFFLVFLSFFGCKRTPTQETIAELKDVLKIVENYQYGDSRSWLQRYYDVLAKVYNDPLAQPDAERVMLDVLNSDASYASKLLLCKSLATLGGEASLPVLEKMLLEQETSNMAVIALASIPLEGAEAILIRSLPKIEGSELIGVINALALRKGSRSSKAISSYMDDQDLPVSASAIHALGVLGGDGSVNILYDKFQTSDFQRGDLAEALVKALQQGDYANEAVVYQSIYDADPSLSVKTAAFRGLLLGMPESEQVDFLLQTLLSSDLEFCESLIPTLTSLPESISLAKIVDKLAVFSPPFQQQLMLAIADRKDGSVRPFVLQQLASTQVEDRLAALKALRSVAVPKDVWLLAKVAATNSDMERELAKEAIYWMESEETDKEILGLAKTEDNQVRSELINAMGYRKIEEARDFVLQQISGQNVKVRLAAIETAGQICTDDALGSVIGNSIKDHVISEDESKIIIDALTRISLNSDDPDFCVEQIHQSLMTDSREEALIVLTSTLGNIQTDVSLGYLKTFLKWDDAPDLQFSCIKALSNWYNDAPLPDLEQLLPELQNAKNRQQTQVGIVNLVQGSDKLSGDEKAAKLITSYENAQTVPEQVIVLNGISRIYSVKAMDFVISKLEDEAIRETSQEAFVRLADNLRYSFEDMVINKVDSLITNTPNEDFREKLKILKRSIEL